MKIQQIEEIVSKKVDERVTIIEQTLNEFMNKYHPVDCAFCHKQILAHYGGMYRSAEGEVHCSHECIYAHYPDLKK